MPPTTLAPTFTYDVFISYSSRDKTWVHWELLTCLKGAGLKVFIDFRDFQPGAPSVTEMERGVSRSSVLLLLLTPAYLVSAWTEFENLMVQTLEPANRTLRLIPLLKAQRDLPTRINFLTYVDFTDLTEHDLAWRKLLTALGAKSSATSITITPSFTTPQPTSSPSVIRQLRTVLAQLYPDKDSAIQITEDVGLPVAMIALGKRAVDHWHAILAEVQKRNRLTK